MMDLARKVAQTIALFLVALVACGAFAGTGYSAPAVDGDGEIVLIDKQSMALFTDAIHWSRQYGLETGGCFQVFSQTGKYIIIDDAVETVRWRRPLRVLLNCHPEDGIWHTHWLAESDTVVGCNVGRSQDLWLIGPYHPFGLVICGVGKDSVIPYTYDATNKPGENMSPEALAKQKADTLYRCVDEPPASLFRPLNICLLDMTSTTRKAS